MYRVETVVHSQLDWTGPGGMTLVARLFNATAGAAVLNASVCVGGLTDPSTGALTLQDSGTAFGYVTATGPTVVRLEGMRSANGTTARIASSPATGYTSLAYERLA